MNPKIIKIDTDEAPKAIGPYSQAVMVEPFMFVSGQIAIDPITGKIIDYTIQGQTKCVLNNIEAILKAAGLNFEAIVKTEVYLKNWDDFQEMNNIYTDRFSHSIKPARQTMQVVRLPLDALIEISCIAFKQNRD